MTQYTPVKTKYKIPNRFVNKKEYDTVLNWLEDLGIEDGYYQELETSSDWLPDFNKVNPFPSNLSVPVWHWKHGFAVNSQ
jgi:putative pyruvate formate lyase activating enzyme